MKNPESLKLPLDASTPLTSTTLGLFLPLQRVRMAFPPVLPGSPHTYAVSKTSDPFGVTTSALLCWLKSRSRPRSRPDRARS